MESKGSTDEQADMSFKTKKEMFENQNNFGNPPQRCLSKQKKESNQNNMSVNLESKLFTEAMQLVYFDNGTICCKTETVEELSKINHPLNVVAVTGIYRSGKSYLLNRLGGKTKAFEIGHTANAKTKGIWVWCRPHPKQEGQVLMLMDTEGIGDILKTKPQEDVWLFTLATLLSSTLVYNTKNAFDADAIGKLSFLKGIEKSVKINEEKTDASSMDFFFPVFVLALRDFSLQTVTRHGKKATPDEYLDQCLDMEKNEKGEHIESYNECRQLIREYFKTRKCFTFGHPCAAGKLRKLGVLSDRDLDNDFVGAFDEFSSYIYNRGPICLKAGRKINGRMFGTLAMHYVNSIRDHETTCIWEARIVMVDAENQYAVKIASDQYKIEMQKRIAYINPKDSTLEGFHQDCMEIASNVFKNAFVFDDKDVFQDEGMTSCNFKKLFTKFKEVCDRNSERACWDVLQQLDRRISGKMKKGAYRHPSGYDEYFDDLNWIIKSYEGKTGLGEKSREVLQAYINKKEKQEKEVFEMVSENQKEQSVDMLSSVEVCQTERSLQCSITKSNSVRDQLVIDATRMEEHLKNEMIKVKQDGKEEIRKKFVENLKLKIKESERQMKEQSGDKEAMATLKDQTTYLTNLMSTIMHDESNDGDGVVAGTVYNVPWDRFALDLDNEPISELKPRPKPKFWIRCPLQ